MSQTEKLFGTLPCSSMTNVAEGHIVIGKDRIITVPDNLKRIAVQYDHNIETVTFDCPRYWDGLDMTVLNIYINYVCADRTVGTFKAINVTADKYYVGTMHFDWVVSKNVSMSKGKIAFQVCIKKTDADGNEEVHWNSEVCRDCYVSESLNCDVGELKEVYPDMFEQWHQEWLDYVNSGEFNGPPGVSPVISVTDIDGGHRITITDVNGTQSFDVMDMTIETDDAVTELLNNIVNVGTTEPITGPAIWFDVSDTDGESGVLKVKAADGTISVFYPVTKAENVTGLEDVADGFLNGVLTIANGGTGATTAAGARTNLGAAAATHYHNASDINSGTLSTDRMATTPVAKGGTGATTAAAARTNLGITPANIGAKVSGAVETITTGGTGSSNGATGLKNLFAAGPTVLSSHQYGTTLPSAGTAGRIFYKKVTS